MPLHGVHRATQVGITASLVAAFVVVDQLAAIWMIMGLEDERPALGQPTTAGFERLWLCHCQSLDKEVLHGVHRATQVGITASLVAAFVVVDQLAAIWMIMGLEDERPALGSPATAGFERLWLCYCQSLDKEVLHGLGLDTISARSCAAVSTI